MEGMNHRIDKNLILQAAPPSGAGYGIRHARHVFDAPGQDNIRITGLDHGRARR